MPPEYFVIYRISATPFVAIWVNQILHSFYQILHKNKESKITYDRNIILYPC